MTDDEPEEICGAPTSKGGKCQNPADSCPWHNTDDPPDTGRRRFIDDDRAVERVFEAAEAGANLKHCAAYGRIHYDTLRRTLDKGEEHSREGEESEFSEFFEEFDAREASGVIKRLNEAKPEHVLATKGYAKKQEIEHSGEMEHSGEATLAVEWNAVEDAADDSEE